MACFCISSVTTCLYHQRPLQPLPPRCTHPTDPPTNPRGVSRKNTRTTLKRRSVGASCRRTFMSHSSTKGKLFRAAKSSAERPSRRPSARAAAGPAARCERGRNSETPPVSDQAGVGCRKKGVELCQREANKTPYSSGSLIPFRDDLKHPSSMAVQSLHGVSANLVSFFVFRGNQRQSKYIINSGAIYN